MKQLEHGLTRILDIKCLANLVVCIRAAQIGLNEAQHIISSGALGSASAPPNLV